MSMKKKKSEGKPPTAHDSPQKSKSRKDDSRKYNFDGGFFSSIRSPKRQYFTIHPEWVSEAACKMTLQEKTQTYPPRRCKSAPPPRTRNPITWLSQPNLAPVQASRTSAEPRGKTKNRSKVNFDGSFFSGVGTPRKEYFTVHPEWVSESFSDGRQRPHQRTNTFENIFGRRSRSAPPLRSRNPITWD